MPNGPNGEKRPADVIANAVLSMRIATGEAEETYAVQGQRKGGLIGAKTRADNLAPSERVEIARKAAEARWSGKREPQ